MKATIKPNGTLVIEAETGLESYALGEWSKGFAGDGSPCDSALQTITDLPPAPPTPSDK